MLIKKKNLTSKEIRYPLRFRRVDTRTTCVRYRASSAVQIVIHWKAFAHWVHRKCTNADNSKADLALHLSHITSAVACPRLLKDQMWKLLHKPDHRDCFVLDPPYFCPQAFDSLCRDPGLHALLPYFSQFVAEKVLSNLGNLGVLKNMVQLTASLLKNPNLFPEPYVGHCLSMPAVAVPPFLFFVLNLNGSDVETTCFSSEILNRVAITMARLEYLWESLHAVP